MLSLHTCKQRLCSPVCAQVSVVGRGSNTTVMKAVTITYSKFLFLDTVNTADFTNANLGGDVQVFSDTFPDDVGTPSAFSSSGTGWNVETIHMAVSSSAICC